MMAMYIASQGQEVALDPGKETRGNRAQLREMIEMGVAELENTIAVKGRREVREGQRQRHEPDIGQLLDGRAPAEEHAVPRAPGNGRENG